MTRTASFPAFASRIQDKEALVAEPLPGKVGKRRFSAYTGADAFIVSLPPPVPAEAGASLSTTTSWRSDVARRPFDKIPDWLTNLLSQVIVLLVRRFLD